MSIGNYWSVECGGVWGRSVVRLQTLTLHPSALPLPSSHISASNRVRQHQSDDPSPSIKALASCLHVLR